MHVVFSKLLQHTKGTRASWKFLEVVLPKFVMGNNGAPVDTKVFKMTKMTYLFETWADKSNIPLPCYILFYIQNKWDV